MPDIKVTIEVQGPAQDVLGWLRQIPIAHDIAVTHAEGEWTPESVETLVGQISDKARRVLRVLADGAPEVSFDQLQRTLKVNGVALGGIMASFGFAENRGIPRPYRVDRNRRVYYMDVELADLILAELKHY